MDFSLFRELAPNHQPQVTIEDAIYGLAEQVKELNSSFSGIFFRDSTPYIRLKTLVNHLEKGRMNNQLYWIKR